jgi:hypothetical protein
MVRLPFFFLRLGNFPARGWNFRQQAEVQKKLALETSGLEEFDSTQSAVPKDRRYDPSCIDYVVGRFDHQAATVMANILELLSSSPTPSSAQSIQ